MCKIKIFNVKIYRRQNSSHTHTHTQLKQTEHNYYKKKKKNVFYYNEHDDECNKRIEISLSYIHKQIIYIHS